MADRTIHGLNWAAVALAVLGGITADQAISIASLLATLAIAIWTEHRRGRAAEAKDEMTFWRQVARSLAEELRRVRGEVGGPDGDEGGDEKPSRETWPG